MQVVLVFRLAQLRYILQVYQYIDIEAMEQIRQAICMLVSGSPKQATATIDMLVRTEPEFFGRLAALIKEELVGRELTGAIVTLNTLAMRCRSRGVTAKDHMLAEDIYAAVRQVVGCRRVSLQDKRLLCPALSQLLGGACSTHREVLELRQQVVQSEDKLASIVVLSAVVGSSGISKHLKIECILQLMPIVMEEGGKLAGAVLSGNGVQAQGKGLVVMEMGMGSRNQMKLELCIKVMEYVVTLLHSIFTGVYSKVQHPYEYQSLISLTSDPHLAQLLIQILQWKNSTTQGPYNVAWLKDLQYAEHCICELHQINNIKKMGFQILSAILSKTAPDYRFDASLNPLLGEVPRLCSFALLDTLNIAQKFQQLNKDYLIGELYDSVLQFLAQCLKFHDMVPIFTENCSQDQLVVCIGSFLKIRDADLGSMDGEYFSDFLEGFAGGANLNQIIRYAISQFTEACCSKFDSFASRLFQYYFHSILKGLHLRLADPQMHIDEDCYQHLYLKSTFAESLLEGETLAIGSSLVGLITLSQQIEARSDFQTALADFLIVMEGNHFHQDQLCTIFFVAATHVHIFQDADLLLAAGRLVATAIGLADTDDQAAAICFDFVKHLYGHFFIRQPLGESQSEQYVAVCSQAIWPQLIKCFTLPRVSQNQYFYSTLRDLISIGALYEGQQRSKPTLCPTAEEISIGLASRKQPRRQVIKMERVGDFLLTQMSAVILTILQKCCSKMVSVVQQRDQQESRSTLVALRIHQLIVECLESLFWISQLESTIEVSKIQFTEYASVACALVTSIMDHSDDAGTGAGLQAGLMQILSTLICQQRLQSPGLKSCQSCIKEQAFQVLLPAMLENPHAEHWLVCICEFTHRISGRYQLSELQRIEELMKGGLTRVSSQQRINELCLFAMVLLSYEQPENWHRIHELVRVNLVRLAKVLAAHEKGARNKGMLELGFHSETVFGITVIRFFHLYLFGFRMEPANQLLSEILSFAERFAQRYNVVEATYLIIGLKSSFKQMSLQNVERLADLVLLVLNKLMSNQDYYGSQTYEEANIRSLSSKTGCVLADPYQEFRSFVHIAGQEGIDLMRHEKFGPAVRSLANISTCKGHPRKLYSISRPKM